MMRKHGKQCTHSGAAASILQLDFQAQTLILSYTTSLKTSGQARNFKTTSD